MSGLQMFAVVPLEPGMNSPVEGTSLVGFRSLGAVVAPVQYKRQPQDEAAISAYAEVVERIFAHMPVLPAPPGAIFRSRSVISRWLELHYVTLTDALAALDGNAAARVTIRLRDGTLTDETLKEWHDLAVESLRMLRGQAAGIATLPENGESGASSLLLTRTSFLVAHERWAAFEAGVRTEQSRHPHLEFALSGPWPPYDFVRMHFGG